MTAHNIRGSSNECGISTRLSPPRIQSMPAGGQGVLLMEKDWEVMRSDDAGDNWKEVSGTLPTDFGFVIDVHAHEPETIYVVPIKSDSEHFVPDGKLRVFRSRTGGNDWEALTTGLPQTNCYVNMLHSAMTPAHIT